MENVQNVGDRAASRRGGDAGGTLAAVTVIALIAVAVALLGYMVTNR
ncbi:hypothetical protein ACWGI8_23410 [Streptomyces sp. NPDC054841]